MSWSISHIGTRAAVKEKVLANTSLPATIKDAIVTVLNDPRDNLPNGVRIEGYGHQSDGSPGTYYSNIAKLEVLPVNLDT